MLNFDKWSALALTRFALAFIVVVNHLGEFVPLGTFAIFKAFGAFEAILGFLLISGYSVGQSYLLKPRGFAIRRVLRLYPAYVVCLIATLCFAFAFSSQPQPSGAAVVANALFLNQAFTSTSIVGPAWTLSLEVWLYCSLPFLARLRPDQLRTLSYLSFACYTTYVVARAALKLPHFSGLGFGANYFLLSFFWIVGLRIAKESASNLSTMLDYKIMATLYLLIELGLRVAWRMKYQSLSIFIEEDLLGYLARAITLCAVYYVFLRWVFSTSPDERRSKRVAVFLGDLSYPLYIAHLVAFSYVQLIDARSTFAAYIVAAVLVAVVIHIGVERPLRRIPVKGRANV